MKLTWRSELAHISAAAMEAAWLSPVLLLFSYTIAGPGRSLSGLPLFVFLYAARVVARYLVAAQLDLGRSRMLLAYLVAGSMLLAFKLQVYPHMPWLSADWLRQLAGDVATASPAVGALLLTAATFVYIWQRGLRTAVEGTHPGDLLAHIQFGVVAIVVSAFLAGRAGYGAAFTPWIFWFFFWGLLAAALTRLGDIARSRQSSVETFWLPILFAVILVVMLGGGLVSLFYSQALVAAIQLLLQPAVRVFEMLYSALVTAVLLAILPFAYLVDAIARLLMSFLGPAKEQETTAMPTGMLGQLEALQRQTAALPPALQALLRWLLVILLLAIVLSLLGAMLRRRRVVEDSAVEEIHESVWSLAEFWAGLRGLWQQLLKRLGVGAQKVVARPPAPASVEEHAAYSIRQVYVHLLDLAASLGRPRPAASTPYEFAHTLAALLPASQTDLDMITDAYVRARYGAAPTHTKEAASVQQAWQRVKADGTRQREDRARSLR